MAFIQIFCLQIVYGQEFYNFSLPSFEMMSLKILSNLDFKLFAYSNLDEIELFVI